MLKNDEKIYQEIYLNKIHNAEIKTDGERLVKTSEKIDALNNAYAQVLSNGKATDKYTKEI
jgi:hypothetical protein